jgi:hypothetical protein
MRLFANVIDICRGAFIRVYGIIELSTYMVREAGAYLGIYG